MELSVIILNYKSARLVRNCLRALSEAVLPEQHEIIVVDNNSHDGVGTMVATEFPHVKFVQSPVNGGMGSGNNIGIRAAAGEYVLIMNPDIYVFQDSIMQLLAHARQNPTIGLLGPRLLNPDRTLQHTCYHWHGMLTPLYRRSFVGKFGFAKRDLDRFLLVDKNHEAIMPVPWIQGSCILVSRAAIDRVGLFDERFFMYFEDTDWCRRMWESGFHVVYHGQVPVIHMHMKMSGGGILDIFRNKLIRAHLKSWVKYEMKYWGKKKPQLETHI